MNTIRSRERRVGGCRRSGAGDIPVRLASGVDCRTVPCGECEKALAEGGSADVLVADRAVSGGWIRGRPQ
jgi:hypothetical protein